jgi:uncharacterized membrane protein
VPGDEEVAKPTELFSRSRIEALSDAVFAIALTLLTLNVTLTIRDGETFSHAFFDDTVTELGAFVLSFAVIALFWMVHHRFMQHVAQFDRGLVKCNFAFLAIIALLPFPSDVLGSYGDEPGASILYAIAISAASLTAHFMWVYAGRKHLLVEGAEREVGNARWRAYTVAGVFLGSIPVAIFVGAHAAQLFWILLWPIRVFITHRYGEDNEGI